MRRKILKILIINHPVYEKMFYGTLQCLFVYATAAFFLRKLIEVYVSVDEQCKQFAISCALNYSVEI